MGVWLFIALAPSSGAFAKQMPACSKSITRAPAQCAAKQMGRHEDDA